MTLTRRLRAKTRRAFHLDREDGATDPILVIAAIAVSLVLLVGGSFAVSGMINNGKDLNAKGDLDKVSTAEAAYTASSNGTGKFIPYVAGSASVALNFDDSATGGTVTGTALEKADVGFTPTAGDKVAVLTDAAGANWIAVSKSSTGNVFIRTSANSTFATLGGTSGAYTVPGTITLPGTLTATNLNTALTNATGF